MQNISSRVRASDFLEGPLIILIMKMTFSTHQVHERFQSSLIALYFQVRRVIIFAKFEYITVKEERNNVA